MSEKYIKRTKKGKGKKKKDFIKEIDAVRVRIKPVIQVALSLMVIESIKEKLKKEKKELKKQLPKQ